MKWFLAQKHNECKIFIEFDRKHDHFENHEKEEKEKKVHAHFETQTDLPISQTFLTHKHQDGQHGNHQRKRKHNSCSQEQELIH